MPRVAVTAPSVRDLRRAALRWLFLRKPRRARLPRHVPPNSAGPGPASASSGAAMTGPNWMQRLGEALVGLGALTLIGLGLVWAWEQVGRAVFWVLGTFVF